MIANQPKFPRPPRLSSDLRIIVIWKVYLKTKRGLLIWLS